MGIWTYRADKPEETTTFNAAMEAMSRNVAPAIIAACDFTRFKRIVDVGGANGALLAAILAASPHSTGVVFDLPHVVREASSVIRLAGLEGRCASWTIPTGVGSGRGRVRAEVRHAYRIPVPDPRRPPERTVG